jgi:hypothetical protein
MTNKRNKDKKGHKQRALGYDSITLTAIFPASSPNAPIILDGLFGPATLHEKMREAVGAGAQAAQAATETMPNG